MPNYRIDENETFVNPYNFVPLESHCRKDFNYKDQKKNGKLTGWINCTLEAKTPIFIPNTTSVKENPKGEKYSNVFDKEIIDESGEKKIVNSYDFYSYTDLSGNKNPTPPVPVIPGSEIRGAIRSAYEAVTNSCLSTIDYNQLLYKRTPVPGIPGQLVFENGEWKIRKCKRAGISRDIVDEKWGGLQVNGVKYNEGEKVNYRYNVQNHVAYDIRKNSNGRGFIHIGDYNEDKKTESIFSYDRRDDGQFKIIKLDEKYVAQILYNFIENILLYRTSNNKTEQHKKYMHLDNNKLKSIKSLFENYKNNKITIDQFYQKLQSQHPITFKYLNGAFIFYKRYRTNNGDKYYLSPAAIGREVFHNTLEDLIKAFNYQPCDHLAHLCHACALFGLAVKGNAAASRVRFTDAVCIDKPEFEEDPVTLKELASPKISATEFYLKRKNNNHDIWNYDYAVNWDSQRDGDPNYIPEIQGRKFYWHQKNPNYAVEDESKITERNVHVRPLREGVTFSFKVYFDNITEKELNTLIWVLEIGGSKELAHKIGMGKPIGLGSVQISVSDIQIRTLEKKNGTISYDFSKHKKDDFVNAGDLLTKNNKLLEQFKIITNFEQAPSKVRYPYNNIPKEKDNIFKWFVANKGNAPKRPKIEQELPNISEANDNNKSLKAYRKEGN